MSISPNSSLAEKLGNIGPPILRSAPFHHQIVGTAALVKHPFFALFDEPQTGKSRQVVDAACELWRKQKINLAIIVCPFKALNTWGSSETGQIKAYGDVPSIVWKLHKKLTLSWCSAPYAQIAGEALQWVVTNYEAIRTSGARLTELLNLGMAGRAKILLVCDESSYLENRTSAQSRAVHKLRAISSRCVILNGTPGNPLGQWNQFNTLDKNILGRHFAHNYYFFRSEFCNLEPIYVKGGKKVLTLSKRQPYKNLAHLSKLTAPYVLQRRKKDCFDLPPKLGGLDSPTPIINEIPLSKESWARYKELKRDCLISIGDSVHIEPNAGVRLMRLAQLTSGHMGGAQEEVSCDRKAVDGVHVFSSEKIDWVLAEIDRSPDQYIIVWTRWVETRKRLMERLKEAGHYVFGIYGGQKELEREVAKTAFFDLKTGLNTDNIKRILVAQPQAGGSCLSLPLATKKIFESNTPRLFDRLQSEERAYGPAQKSTLTIVEAHAVGPNGEKTVDRIIWDQLRKHLDVSNMTAQAWRSALEDE